MSDGGTIISAVAWGRRGILISVAALGFSCVMTQLALMRELLSAFAGNEMVLGVVLGLWLLLMGVGTALGRTADRLRNPLAILVVIQILVAILPPMQVFALRALRNVVFVRGAEVGVTGTVLSSAALLLPYCLVAGYGLVLACSILNRIGDASGPGHVYVADSVGSVFGGVLFSFVLVQLLDHIALLVVPAILNLGTALWLCASLGRRTSSFRFSNRAPWAVCVLALALGISVIAWLAGLDARSTSLQFPGQDVLFRANSPYGRLIVTESAGQTSFIENGVPIVSTPNVEQVEESAHYAMAQRPNARRVLLVSGGVAGVAREILKYNVSAVDCVELDPLVIETGRRFLPENLADQHINVLTEDGRHFIRETTNRYDVIILALPDPSTAQLNRFFTVEFFGEVKRVLSDEGVLSFALGHYENYVSPQLARILASAQRTLKQSFANLLILPGGRVFFIASDGVLHQDIAARIEQRQIKTKLVNCHYLDAMLTRDRMADLSRAVMRPPAVNRDFSPVLYFYHLRHWMSQFDTAFGPIHVIILVLFFVYLIRLRGPALVLFASGFAGSALEIVLLLAFQVLCGSVYHQVGIIVTVFMVGLAGGAMLANHRNRLEGVDVNSEGSGRRRLTVLAIALAVFAVLLPGLLPLLNRSNAVEASLFVVKAAIVCLTLLLAAIVGMQFPLATRLQSNRMVAGASQLYTADFVGAFLGALLASTLLIPIIGVLGVCLVTAGLNVLAGGTLWLRKAAA